MRICATREVRLQAHIGDVLGLIATEELVEAVLVGHSYGGMVITGAAAALQRTDPSERFGLSEVDAEWLRRRHVPYPFGMYWEPLDYAAALLHSLPRRLLAFAEGRGSQ